MRAEPDYLRHLTAESSRFAEVIRKLPADARVPPCPDWTGDDLLWHLGEVQWFWGTVVRQGVTGEQAGQLKPGRPANRPELLEFFDRASADLSEALAAVPPERQAWTWSREQTAGFIRRRQAHEALIHRVDAELAARDRTPMDPGLSADGVDEVLRIMYGALPDWGTFTPRPGQTLRLRAADTGDTWLVTLGRFTGTDPGSGKAYDEPDISTAARDEGEAAAASVTGTAADLDCWLWHRAPAAPVNRSGDEAVLSGFDSAIAPGID